MLTLRKKLQEGIYKIHLKFKTQIMGTVEKNLGEKCENLYERHNKETQLQSYERNKKNHLVKFVKVIEDT